MIFIRFYPGKDERCKEIERKFFQTVSISIFLRNWKLSAAQSDRQTEREKDRQSERQTEWNRKKANERETDIQTGREKHRPCDEFTDRHTNIGGYANQQTHPHTQTGKLDKLTDFSLLLLSLRSLFLSSHSLSLVLLPSPQSPDYPDPGPLALNQMYGQRRTCKYGYIGYSLYPACPYLYVLTCPHLCFMK